MSDSRPRSEETTAMSVRLLSAISLVGAVHTPLADAAETMDRESI